MEFSHKPVLLEECIENLQIKPKGVYMDGTLGGAGHSSEIYKQLKTGGTLIGIDQDSFALQIASERLRSLQGQGTLIFENTNFINMKAVCEKHHIEAVDGILLDLGVSSHQLDEASRGFSYQQDAGLDMRMDTRSSLTAEIIVNEYPPEKIKKIIREYGEENWAVRIAEFIAEARKKERIKTTGQLVEVIKAAIPSGARKDGPHPAKRTFQAIRIEVNNELGILEKTIEDAVELLRPEGRLCIITFHSLEDRIVKETFRSKVKPCTCPPQFPVCICGKKPSVELVTRKPITASKTELDENPRSRSAKLRVVQKIL